MGLKVFLLVWDSSVPWDRMIGCARHPSQPVCCDRLTDPWQPSSAWSPVTSLQKLPEASTAPLSVTVVTETVFCQWQNSAECPVLGCVCHTPSNLQHLSNTPCRVGLSDIPQKRSKQGALELTQPQLSPLRTVQGGRSRKETQVSSASQMKAWNLPR